MVRRLMSNLFLGTDLEVPRPSQGLVAIRYQTVSPCLHTDSDVVLDPVPDRHQMVCTGDFRFIWL